MDENIDTLSEREKEALRLLLAGHDAKSIAAALDLSVHTINDRLRDCRRKLGVSSSREAARMLGRAEAGDPEFLGHMKIGMGDTPPPVESPSPPQRRRTIGHPLVWLGGGMIIMSLLIAALVFTALPGQNAAPPADTPTSAITATAPAATAARDWAGILDRGEWAESWSKAAHFFQTQVTKDKWVSQVQPVRGPLGAVTSRTFASGQRMTTLPGGMTGNYALVVFRTDFANAKGATETVTLTRENGAWKVIGYFIR
tara:strand:- start:36 stop:803 length:768 start_codon:yes stop_codon:yes gene_type:complete